VASVTNNGTGFGATLAWRQQGNLYQSHWATAVADEGFLYGIPSPSSPQARLTCLDIKTGVNRWTQTTVGSRSIGFGSIIKCANALIVLTEAGELVLVEPNPTEYRELARRSVLSLYCWNHVTLANGRLYARCTSANAQLVALDVAPISVPLPPLQLAAERGATPDSLGLTVRAADGTALDAAQLGRVELLTTTNLLLPVAQWSTNTPAFNAKDGAGSAQIPRGLEPARFLRAREKSKSETTGTAGGLPKAERLKAAVPFGLLAAIRTRLITHHAARGLIAPIHVRRARSRPGMMVDLPPRRQVGHNLRRSEAPFVDLERFTNERLT
jgi:hypothetical protein